MSRKQHISICICTFRRPALLSRLLSKLGQLETDNRFSYSIVIVDNDHCESARKTAEKHAARSRVKIIYGVEPEQNIALARNKAINKADGEYIAFIDDDEFPGRSWLLNLYECLCHYKADGVLGPVIPYYEIKPPSWVIKGKLFDRPSHPTGYVLEWNKTRTGNVLLKREVFKESSEWFDPRFGSGGEDRDFFRRKINDGRTFIWCNEAPVYESITPKRWSRKVLVRRALLRGKVAVNAPGAKPLNITKSVIAFLGYATFLPATILLGQHVFMNYLIKSCDHLGKIIAFLGFDLVKEKYIVC